MKKFDIDKRFTEKVTEYLMKGYTIHSDSMAGSQGEVGKIDLVKGEELIRIYLSDESDFHWDDLEGKWNGKMRILRVGKWIHPAGKSKYNNTVWMSELDILEEVRFYQLDNYKDTWYVEDLEEALDCQRLHWDRRLKYRSYNSELIDITSDATKEVAAKYLKNHQDYQRVSRDKITVCKRVYHNEDSTPDYIIKYNDTQVYKLK